MTIPQRVLFVNPHYPCDPSTLLLHPPLGYGYLSRHLKQAGHAVQHADLPLLGNDVSALTQIVEDFQPTVVGVTSVSQSYAQALEIAQYIKNYNANIFEVFGGPHVSFIAEEVLERHSVVDGVISFDGEVSFVHLCNSLAERHDIATREIAGLTARHTNGIHTTPPLPPVLDIDSLGAPDRSIFDMEAYLNHDYETVVMTARGCPSQCAFCSTSKAGRTYRCNSVNHICDEVEGLLEFGFSSIFFGDDTFSGNPQRILDFAKEVKRRRLDFQWTSNMRAHDAKPEILDAIKESGGYRVFVGFESIQQSALNLVKKNTAPERLYEVAKRIQSHGIELHTSFIVGAPGDTHESLAETLDFIRMINPTVATFNVIEPRPGTELYNNPERFGVHMPNKYWYETSDWLSSPVCSTDSLTSNEISTWVSRMYDEFCSPDFLGPEHLERLNLLTDAWNKRVEKKRLAASGRIQTKHHKEPSDA